MPHDSSNPLHDLHRQAEADFVSYGDIEIVQTFGEPQAEYAAMRKSAALMDWPQRGFLQLTGKDRLTFLNGIISAETFNKQTKQPLRAGETRYSFLLNLRGRIVADMNVIELGDRTLIETEARLAKPLVDVLEAYRFAEQVKILDRTSELHEVALIGPRAAEFAPQEPSVINWSDDLAGVPVVKVLVPVQDARTLWMRLIEHFATPDQVGKRNLRPIGWAAFNTVRIEAGRPMLGIDFDAAPVATAMPSKQQRESAEGSEAGAGMLPGETGLMDRAVSLTKCYVGQEIVARMHARGQIARKVVGIRMNDDALPIAGTHVMDRESNPIGIVTSSTNSPVLSNIAVCVAVVKRPFFETGTRLRIAAEGAIREGMVVETPFV